MAERTQEAEAGAEPHRRGSDGATPRPPPPRSEKLKAELSGLLDEIDEVLESNAEDFVKSYVQKGGQQCSQLVLAQGTDPGARLSRAASAGRGCPCLPITGVVRRRRHRSAFPMPPRWPSPVLARAAWSWPATAADCGNLIGHRSMEEANAQADQFSGVKRSPVRPGPRWRWSSCSSCSWSTTEKVE